MFRVRALDALAGAETQIDRSPGGEERGQRAHVSGRRAAAAEARGEPRKTAVVGEALGAKKETFYGLSGFGDLVATCHGAWSRNREFGEKIGAGHPVAALLDGRRTVVEGYRTTRALNDLCLQKGLTAPILGEVYAILYQGKKPMDALMALMTRELKRETASPFARKA